MLPLLPSEVQAQVRDRLTGSVAVEVWIDQDGLPARISSTKPGEGPTVTTYTRWGQDVDVTRPAQDEVADPPRLPPQPSASTGGR
jgi:hypothetical protein